MNKENKFQFFIDNNLYLRKMRLRNGKFYIDSRYHPYKKENLEQEQVSNASSDDFEKQIQELEAILETFSKNYSTENIKMEIISNPVVDDNEDGGDDDERDDLIKNDGDDNKKEKCKHCPEFLTYGYDQNNLLHCQGCHRVWDGYAQCPCWMEDI